MLTRNCCLTTLSVHIFSVVDNMSPEELVLISAAVVIILTKKASRRKKPRWWVRNYLQNKNNVFSDLPLVHYTTLQTLLLRVTSPLIDNKCSTAMQTTSSAS
ncbi:hypothetical protein JYU34_010359 [Plutella xylostella]|uniref:Uncharacterized protein n=1 Tax=Plutella xylostella TaxID=51655 RepID=A0ABQ7QIC9_PLUXY|nr:hypothetical protein JYU34_010359 [Plutella xylostella]